MEKTEFDRRVAYNTEVLKAAVEKDTPLTSILHQVYTWEYKPGEAHFSILIRNAYDIIPSLFLGVLARCNTNGIDAHDINESGEIVDVEIKTSETAKSKIWKTAGETLYVGLQNVKSRRRAFTSSISASYACHSDINKKSKNMRTVLMITDTDGDNTYIAAYELEGEVVMKYLNRSDCKTRDIKFATFMNYGHRCETVIPLKGIDKFKQDVLVTAKQLAPNEYFV